MSAKKGKAKPLRPTFDGATVIAQVLERTRTDVQRVRSKKPQLSFAIYFARHMGSFMAEGFRPDFPEVQSGEKQSQAVSGPKRVDVNYSTTAAGLGFAISLKSVHFGEKANGTVDFIHNMKRNDEELRVEATAHHLRQPYAVLAAVVFLPFESCIDLPTSSFASWVRYLWPLKGRSEPEDPPDRFELVFIGLYDRRGTAMGFYQVGGKDVECPRHGQPKKLLAFDGFLKLVKSTYLKRNGKDFYFEGEEPPA